VFAAAVAVSLILHSGITHAQTAATNGWKVPRLADGHPDLQGIWDWKTITPLDRPAEFASQKLLTKEQMATLEKKALVAEGVELVDKGDTGIGAYNQAFRDRGLNAADLRTSLIEDPTDGKMPATQPGAVVQKGTTNIEIPAQPPIRYRSGGAGTDGPEMRGLAERCLMGFNTGPPMDPGGYNNNLQVIQTPKYVVLFTEMIHDARIVPLDGRGHLPENVRQWSGDSRGHWEGDTLVVDTTNFTEKTASFERSNVRSARNDKDLTALGTGRTLHLVERFTRVSDSMLNYEYTVDDPVTFTRTFSVKVPMRRLTGDHAQIFEYACHEGNHALHDMLSVARGVDRKAAERSAAKK
jgi:hypothetical protein